MKLLEGRISKNENHPLLKATQISDSDGDQVKKCDELGQNYLSTSPPTIKKSTGKFIYRCSPSFQVYWILQGVLYLWLDRQILPHFCLFSRAISSFWRLQHSVYVTYKQTEVNKTKKATFQNFECKYILTFSVTAFAGRPRFFATAVSDISNLVCEKSAIFI